MTPQVHSILETCLCAEDLPAVEAFYRDILGLTVYSSESGRHVFFRCNQAMLLIFNPAATTTGRVVVNDVELPRHGTTGAGHIALRISDGEVSNWASRLRDAGVPIEAEVDWPNGGRSLYFRDPAGNSLELATPRLWELPG